MLFSKLKHCFYILQYNGFTGELTKDLLSLDSPLQYLHAPWF